MKFGKEFASQMVPEWHETYLNYNDLKSILKRINKSSLETIEQNAMTSPDDSSFSIRLEDDDEVMYFKRLDEEFSKVHKFYVSKVEEVMDEAAALEKQMHALVAFRIKLHGSSEMMPDSVTVRGASSRQNSIDMIEEEKSDESNDDKRQSSYNLQEDAQCPSQMQILDRVTVNIHNPGTPLSTVKILLNLPKQTNFRFSKDNLKKAQEQLKKAFIVIHFKLRHLKNYSFLNMLAFSKIMKKYDKITSKTASKSYMKVVDDAFLGRSNEVNKLIVRVEDTFIKHFTNSNRKQGMNMLRPTPKREKHGITFSYGFLAGCSVTLVLALVFVIHARHNLEGGGLKYMNTMFPLYSLFGFVLLHMIMYAGNIYFWRRYKVNYPFVLSLNQGKGLCYRDLLYLSFALAVITLVSVISNLDMEMDPETHDYNTFNELRPLLIAVIIICILICPLNILYRSSRFFFLSCIFRCFCAPLYTVVLADCIMADQLTSQVQALRSIKFYICYYGWGDFKHREDACKTNDTYNTFNFIIAGIPYAIRLFQNVRLMYQTGNKLWGYNALKYFTTIIAVCTRIAHSVKEDDLNWKIVAWICSAVAAVLCTYWDIVVDWGLLQSNSKNRWLRDKLVVPHKSVYFGAMVLNVILRFAWLETVLNFKPSSFHAEALITIVASLEIIRRGIWNFFRLENEHLTNVSKFRAFKSVPLPFNYDDEDDD